MPSWIKGVLNYSMLMWVGMSLYYHLGPDDIDFEGTDFALNRAFEYQLFKIDEHLAFYVPKDLTSDDLEIVKYQPGELPFRWLCGGCQRNYSDLTIFAPLYRKGDLIFSGTLGNDGSALSDHQSPGYQGYGNH